MKLVSKVQSKHRDALQTMTSVLSWFRRNIKNIESKTEQTNVIFQYSDLFNVYRAIRAAYADPGSSCSKNAHAF